ncbi:MAG TPA: hypothetical protein DEG96_09465 [Candidatus Atribacteria bacterium]|nr:hypothetical protein [Candidatus Atribacteria bacterium]
MNTKVPQVIDVLMKYGSFARPLVNRALSNDKLNPAWEEYFKAIRYDWQKEYTLELKCVERGIRRCRGDQTVKYLLLSLELSVLQNLKDRKGIDCTLFIITILIYLLNNLYFVIVQELIDKKIR